jgi:uncharacterized protein YqeY
MELKERMATALKEAIRGQDATRRNALRMLLTAVKNKEKELRRDLSEAELQQVISSQVKTRRESVEQYRQGGREELATEEEREIAILQDFLPEQLDEEAIKQLIEQAIAEVGAQSMKDMGRVMKAVMPKVAGRADGKMVNELVRGKLQ